MTTIIQREPQKSDREGGRTDLLADVAPVDQIPHERPKLPGDGALVLDGQVRDAAPRVDGEAVGRDGPRGAGGDAAAAGAAAVGGVCFRGVVNVGGELRWYPSVRYTHTQRQAAF